MWNNKDLRKEPDPIEFVPFGVDMLSSENLTDQIYRMLLLFTKKRFETQNTTLTTRHISDFGNVLVNDIYIPCCERTAFTRQIDILNDGYPGNFSVVHMENETDPDPVLLSIKEQQKPKKVKYNGRCKKFYKLTNFQEVSDDVINSSSEYFGVKDSGYIIPIYHRIEESGVYSNARRIAWPALAANMYSDRVNLWNVQVQDTGCGEISDYMKFVCGVHEEHIKSLFYARKSPLTETGRKRPILHWVKAHERRVKEGVDIDVRKHMRGVYEFILDGLKFKITSPDKEHERKVAESIKANQ